MRRLKLQVERAVRPVVAGEARKDRWREDLYAHLWDIYEDERGRGARGVEAIDRAVLRFGDPAGVRRELQRSVPWLERILFVPLPGLTRMRRSGVRRLTAMREISEFKCAVRAALALLGVMIVVAFVLNPLLGSALRPEPDYERVLVLGSTIGLLSVLNLFTVMLLNVAAYFAFRDERVGRPDRARVWAYAVLTGVVVFASGLVFSILGGGYFVFSWRDVAALAGMAVAVPALTTLSSLSTAVESRRWRQWGRLRIEAP
jgi:hypothetical protein